MNNKHIEQFFLGLGIGLAVGGVTALLVAPLSGQQLRDKIEDEFLKTKARVQRFAHPEEYTRFKA